MNILYIVGDFKDSQSDQAMCLSGILAESSNVVYVE